MKKQITLTPLPASEETKVIIPEPRLQVNWTPQEDITTFELAQCIPLLYQVINFQEIIPETIDRSAPFMRHFTVIEFL